MPGILGIPAIPTAAELTAAGIALEDHAAAQAAGLIDHFMSGLDARITQLRALEEDAAGRITAAVGQALTLAARIDGATIKLGDPK